VSVLLAVDPGIRKSGVALFSEHKLVAAACVKSSHEGDGPRACAEMAEEILHWARVQLPVPANVNLHRLAVEWQRIYASEGATVGHKGDPNALMGSVGVACALAALLPAAEVWSGVGHDWKGGVAKPKRVIDPYPIEARVRARLDEDELRKLEANWPGDKRQTWDLIDAAAIGMFVLGRFDRVRKFARE
jgi:hypothetical protein